MSDRDLLEPLGITSTEVKSLVDEYVANGGKIKQCKEGVALNFRLLDLTVPEHPKKIQVFKKKSKKSKK